MGLMRFLVTPPQAVGPQVANQVCFAGIDRVAWPARVGIGEGELLLDRAISESGSLLLPWHVKGHGQPILSTASLIERPEPYHLPLELARGTISQLCNQMAEWQLIGMTIPKPASAKVAESIKQFGHAAVNQEDRTACSRLSQQAIEIALDASNQLASAYVEQSMTVRRRVGKLLSFIGGDLGHSPLDNRTAKQFLNTFNAALIPLRWRDIEATEGSQSWDLPDKQIAWCAAQGIRVFSSPLLQLDTQGIPTWLYLWEDDFDNLQSFVNDFVSTTVKRYKGKVNFWQAAGRINGAEVLSLSEDECLQLTALVVEQIRSLDPEKPVLMSINQPWAEYMRGRAIDYPPLHFADTLIRGGLEIAGLVLEINLGYTPRGTLPRTLVELSQQLDMWALLGLPIFVSICVPSSHEADPLAQYQTGFLPEKPNSQSQQAWVARAVPLILAKSFVRGVIWNQLSDNEPHDFPHGGLFDTQGRPKPAMKTLGAIRHAYLK